MNALRLADFRTAVAGAGGRRGLTPDAVVAATRDGPLVPLNELLTSPTLFDTRGEKGAGYYAEAWALVQYLHRAKTTPFAGYLKEIAARPAGKAIGSDAEIAEFERFFGKIDEHFVRQWARCILSLPAP